MPKGRGGCFHCGNPSARTIQVWLYDYTEETYANGTRKQVTADSIQRAYCTRCAVDVAAAARATLARHHPGYLGCAICGARSAGRILVWERTTDERKRSVDTHSRAYCANHLVDAYLDVSGPLDPATFRPAGGNGGDLAATRARIKGSSRQHPEHRRN